MTDVTTPSAAPDAPAPTRERLLRAAAGLFRNKGYSGTGLAELLAAAGAPKGSLYHHFPNGKSDLALAAADWASGQMLLLIEASFTPAPTFREGAKTVCYKLAKLFDQQGKWSGCPVSATLFEGPENEAFHQHAAHLFEGWIAETARHARRLGLPEPEARAAAENFYILLQGGWQLARVRRQSDVIRGLYLQLQKND
ncbi:TetR/AcrR family transcriptional regulator [Leisingera methylohalidivorans]|uniref:TetR family transcriptional regulator n=1 Tax=Leisingera methylohalidivorans DSM 14336 TaxID=999552 RepID=V9VMF4_9RHOB|nr:TetR/AcrR family transcriptional regulator [Leisingera methylohalidivorans]AHC99750.1 TetR family transcriptional regulator [Leisingera methylohalidivorans DSM 14336]